MGGRKGVDGRRERRHISNRRDLYLGKNITKHGVVKDIFLRIGY